MARLKKHLDILKVRLSERSEIRRIQQLKNPTLNHLLISILAAKQKVSGPEEKLVIKECEAIRQSLLSNDSMISYEIFDAPSKKVSDICKKAASPEVWCRFIYKITQFYSVNNVLEIGTNVGMSGSYILQALKMKETGKLWTMEGIPGLCEIAAHNFNLVAKPESFEIIHGLYDATFPALLKQKNKYDLLFIDGNHQKEPTLNYFQALKKSINDVAIFIFDDINWSTGMQEAWEIIKNDNTVTFSIDLYKQGIIIIDKASDSKNVAFNLHLAY